MAKKTTKKTTKKAPAKAIAEAPEAKTDENEQKRAKTGAQKGRVGKEPEIRRAVCRAAIRTISNAMYSSSMVSLIGNECADDGALTKKQIREVIGPILKDLELEA